MKDVTVCLDSSPSSAYPSLLLTIMLGGRRVRPSHLALWLTLGQARGQLTACTQWLGSGLWAWRWAWPGTGPKVVPSPSLSTTQWCSGWDPGPLWCALPQVGIWGMNQQMGVVSAFVSLWLFAFQLKNKYLVHFFPPREKWKVILNTLAFLPEFVLVSCTLKDTETAQSCEEFGTALLIWPHLCGVYTSELRESAAEELSGGRGAGEESSYQMFFLEFTLLLKVRWIEWENRRLFFQALPEQLV